MAKKKKKKKSVRTISVSGLSVSDITGMSFTDFNKLNEKDLRALTSRLVSAGNKRIRLLEKRGVKSPAYQALGTDVRFSTKLPKGTTKEQRVNLLRQEFSRARNFLTSKTSTMSGYKSYVKGIREDIETSIGRKIKDVDLNTAFERLHKLQEKGIIPSTTGVKGSSKGSIHARDFIIEQMLDKPNITEEEIFDLTEEDYTKYYEETESTDL